MSVYLAVDDVVVTLVMLLHVSEPPNFEISTPRKAILNEVTYTFYTTFSEVL